MATFNHCPNCKKKPSSYGSYMDIYECTKCKTKYCYKCGGKYCPDCGGTSRKWIGKVCS